MNTVLKSVAAILGILNSVGGVIAGIWLAISGQWGLIGYGIVGLIFSGFGLGLALMPGLLLLGPAAVFQTKGKRTGFLVFGFLGALYTNLVLTIWCMMVLYFFLRKAGSVSIIPVLLWSYGVATGPIAWMAQKEQNEFSMISAFVSQLAYLLVMLTVMFFPVALADVLVLFGLVMLVGLIIQARVAWRMEGEIAT